MLNFYLCEHCKNVAIKLVDKGVPLVCCGEKMTLLVPMQSDGAIEKHLPVLAFDGNTLTVTVGEVLHPMLENHYINFIVVELVDGYLIKHLSPASQPVTKFNVKKDDVVAVYEYCNLHGLYKVDVK